jgi:hypothetical protein
MTKVGKSRLFVCMMTCIVLLALGITSANATLFGLLKTKKRTETPKAQSLMIFPFDKDPEIANKVPETFGKDVSDSLRSLMIGNNLYSVYLYSDRLAPVQRARTDNILKVPDVTGPFFVDKIKASKLADLLATDYYIVGSIENYDYDKDKKSVELMLKMDLVLTRTGKVVQEYMVGGKTDESNKAMSEDELRAIAAGKAVEALKLKLTETEESADKSKSNGISEKK